MSKNIYIVRINYRPDHIVSTRNSKSILGTISSLPNSRQAVLKSHIHPSKKGCTSNPNFHVMGGSFHPVDVTTCHEFPRSPGAELFQLAPNLLMAESKLFSLPSLPPGENFTYTINLQKRH